MGIDCWADSSRPLARSCAKLAKALARHVDNPVAVSRVCRSGLSRLRAYGGSTVVLNWSRTRQTGTNNSWTRVTT